ITTVGRDHGDLPRPQSRPGGHPAVAVIEIHVAAHVEDSNDVRQSGRVIEPGAAVEERHAAHPVGVGIKHEQGYRLRQAPDKGQTDVVKVAGTEEGHASCRIVRVAQELPEGGFEASEAPEAAGQPDGRCPGAERVYFGLAATQEILLREDAAIKVENAYVH